jgi:hypothetical protein
MNYVRQFANWFARAKDLKANADDMNPLRRESRNSREVHHK